MSISGISNSNSLAFLGEVRSAKETLQAQKLSSSQSQALDKATTPSISGAEADNTSNNLYAEISVNDKVVAKIWESGLTKLPNSHASLASELSQSGTGIQTAQERAEQIAKALGGKIDYANQPSSYSFSESLANLLSSQ